MLFFMILSVDEEGSGKKNVSWQEQVAVMQRETHLEWQVYQSY